MAGTLQNSWDLLSQSFSVLRKEKQLLFFPVLSAISTSLVIASFLLPLYASGELVQMAGKDFLKNAYAGTLLILFAFYYLTSFTTLFFNAALIASSGLVLKGYPASVSTGLRMAAARMGRIAYWALVASTIGWLLRAISNRGSRVGRFVSGIFGVGWAMLTYFILPVIIFEDIPVFQAMDRSVALVRKAWGEEAVGGVSFSILWFLAALPGFALIGYSSHVHSAVGIVAGVLYFLLLATVAPAATGVYTVAVYDYAAHSELPLGSRDRWVHDAYSSDNRSNSLASEPVIEATLLSVEVMSSATGDTFLIRAQAGNTVYHASYSVEAIDGGFRADEWPPSTLVKLRVQGKWLIVSGPGSGEIPCHYFQVAAPHLV